jgi:acylphosphatase
VRNRADGSVEILAWGNEQAVSALIEHCREGPPAAIVESVEVSEADAEPSVGFEARASG